MSNARIKEGIPVVTAVARRRRFSPQDKIVAIISFIALILASMSVELFLPTRRRMRQFSCAPENKE